MAYKGQKRFTVHVLGVLDDNVLSQETAACGVCSRS